jgi:hypothetical protein
MRDYITDLPHVCVGYCQYSDWGYRERTGLWTNIPLTPLACGSTCPNMVGKWGHLLIEALLEAASAPDAVTPISPR